ncbi:MAG: coenzyme F420-0:L-glutamate ligase [Candidatus Binatus sp.]|uniref:coenzyme F420-0:L-glutamate ligase n=1 Tax=Candidatus Binatus sp. TaxID=2811406 RepID=UPI002726811F|nr:coenzyme F420-0:L-glutamate ligase [Candidatus Binatus sp.]MDO8433927.1 coenzyme F420-0:L-glutamate ligase [Candidatus Binatus sp.]
MRTISLTAVEGIPMIKAGDDLAALIADGLQQTGLKLEHGDILVVCQKVVSKAEGRVLDLKEIEPSDFAKNLAARWEKDPRAVEVVLRQTNRIVRNDHGVIIVETGPGWVCANAGVDESNSLEDDRAILLPEDPDASARGLRDELRKRFGVTVAVLITDTFGRPWRDGLTEVCLGIAGMNPMLDLRGTNDLGGRELHHTVVAIADDIACAAGLLMEKAGATPAVVVRGYQYEPYEGSAKVLIRPPEADLFR